MSKRRITKCKKERELHYDTYKLFGEERRQMADDYCYKNNLMRSDFLAMVIDQFFEKQIRANLAEKSHDELIDMIMNLKKET